MRSYWIRVALIQWLVFTSRGKFGHSNMHRGKTMEDPEK